MPHSPGILVDSSVTDDTNSLGQGKGEAWVPVYGQSDIIWEDVVRLAAGDAKQDTFCIEDTFTVLNAEKQMRRQVRVQGKLRVYARYYLEAPRWQMSKQQLEEMTHTPPDKRKNADKGSGGWATIEIPIPCRIDTVEHDCHRPPPIFAGESTLPVPPAGE